jgi:hypothetical protein
MAKSASQPAAKSTSKPATPKPQAATPAPEPVPAPKPVLRTTGLSPKEQKLQALRAKLAHTQSGAKPLPGASAQTFNAKSSFAGKKTAFQRKAV